MKKLLALIIEDDLEVADLYCHALGLIGLQPESVTDPEQAKIRLREAVPALILLDLRFRTEFAGPDLLGWIKSDKRLAKVPVIVISGYPRHSERLVDQADFILLKPVDLRQLMALALRLANTDSVRLETFGTNLLDEDTFMERLAFNWTSTAKKGAHIFPVILLSIRPRTEPDAGSLFDRPYDKLKVDIANRIARRTRSADCCVRLREDQFSVMLYAIDDPSNAEMVALRLIQALEEPFYIDGELISLDVKAGIALNNRPDGAPGDMVDRARVAAEEAFHQNKKIMLSVAENG